MSEANIVILKAKAKNFKNYLLNYSPTPLVLEKLEAYNEDNIVDELSSTLVPIMTVGCLEIMIDQFINELTIPEGELDAVRYKIMRYLKLFYELLV
jgi:hypothetical protein